MQPAENRRGSDAVTGGQLVSVWACRNDDSPEMALVKQSQSPARANAGTSAVGFGAMAHAENAHGSGAIKGANVGAGLIEPLNSLRRQAAPDQADRAVGGHAVCPYTFPHSSRNRRRGEIGWSRLQAWGRSSFLSGLPSSGYATHADDGK
jgi:hypothetical protein